MKTGRMGRWFGPVFEAERKTRARRWQGYATRSLFVLSLLAGLILVWLDQSEQGGPITVQQMAETGSSAYFVLTFLELVAVLTIAPSATAGAICLDKSRGALAHVFVTDLSDREIVLGKLAARLFPVWGLLACALPVAAMATLLGGIDPVALTGALVIAAGVAFLGCSLALMLSVWASKTHEVITVVFGVGALWILACPVWDVVFSLGTRPPIWLERTNPFYLTNAPYSYPGETSLVEPILFALGCGLIGIGFTAVAIWKVRVVGCRSAGVQARRVGLVDLAVAWVRGRVRWGKGPKLDANPVLWREWHRNRPSRWSEFVWVGYEILCAVASIGLTIAALLDSPTAVKDALPGLAVGTLVTLGLILVSASTASVLAEERARGSLDVLLSTPISTRTILWAKWRGAFRRIPWLAFWPVVVGVAYSIFEKLEFIQVALLYCVPILIIVQGAALVSLGLALATWIKRTGQATGWTIAVLVASVVGWPILAAYIPLADQVTIQKNQTALVRALREDVLFMGSPIANISVPLVVSMTTATARMPNLQAECEALLILIVAWAAVYGLVAWVLFEATVRTFDRCLGRTPERPSTPRLEPPAKGRADRSKLKGWGWRTPGAGGRRVVRAESFAPPPR